MLDLLLSRLQRRHLLRAGHLCRKLLLRLLRVGSFARRILLLGGLRYGVDQEGLLDGLCYLQSLWVPGVLHVLLLDLQLLLLGRLLLLLLLLSWVLFWLHIVIIVDLLCIVHLGLSVLLLLLVLHGDIVVVDAFVVDGWLLLCWLLLGGPLILLVSLVGIGCEVLHALEAFRHDFVFEVFSVCWVFGLSVEDGLLELARQFLGDFALLDVFIQVPDPRDDPRVYLILLLIHA